MPRTSIDDVVCSFILGETSKPAGNTRATETRLVLHGHTIAKRENGRIFMTLAGFPSKLTRDRLNRFLGMVGSSRKFWQEQGRQYFGVPGGHFQHIEDDQWVIVQ